MNVPLIKIEKKTTGKVDQAKVLISIFCQLYDIKLSKSELTVLAYFMVYKISQVTEDLILKAKIMANKDSLHNAMSKLRKFGLIRKINKEDVLNDSLNVNLEPVMGIIIKIDNQ